MHEWWTIFVVVIVVGIASCSMIGLCCFGIRLLSHDPVSRSPSSVIYTKRTQPTDFRRSQVRQVPDKKRQAQEEDDEEEEEVTRELALV